MRYAVGACVSQCNDSREEHPVAFASLMLSSNQIQWSTIEKEAHAVVWAFQRCDTLLFGAEIEILSDHNPLAYLTNNMSKRKVYKVGFSFAKVLL